MTYENFAKAMTEKDKSITRGTIKNFAIKFALLLFSCSLSISMVISSIVGNAFSVIFMILTLFLYIWSFDILVDSGDYFTKLNKVVRFWWLIALVVLVSCFLINTFII